MSKFIRSTKALEFEHPDGGEKFRVTREYLGYVPDWVLETPLFQLAASGKNPVITMVGSETSTVAATSPGISDEEQELRAKGKALKIPKAAKLSLQELVLAIDAVENPPDDTSAEVAGLRARAEELGINDAEELSVMDLVLAIQEKEKPPREPAAVDPSSKPAASEPGQKKEK